MPLTDTRIKAAKPKAKRYRLNDGQGLKLEVTPAGGRFWRYRYRIDGKENLYTVGEWSVAPDGETTEQALARRLAGRFTLAEARIERQRLRDMVVRGQHPLATKRAERLALAHSSANTFKAVAREFVVKRGSGWSASHLKRFERFLMANVYPDIGATPVRDVTSATVLMLLRKVEERGATSLATTGRGLIGQVFRYAIATGKADTDPTAALRGALQVHKTEHHKPLERADIPAFFAALSAGRTVRQTEIAVRLLAYLFTRPIELRAAPWPEFDLEAADWRIPQERMKMKRPHFVPLPTQAIALLRELHTLTGRQQWLFPNTRRLREHMSHNTLNTVIDRMGFGGGKFSAHGFRATASTMLHEAGFDTRLIELQLAHQDQNKSRASYDHSLRLPERRTMMQAWADMLDSLAKPRSNLVLLRAPVQALA